MVYNLVGESDPEIRDEQDTAKLDGSKKASKFQKGYIYTWPGNAGRFSDRRQDLQERGNVEK